MRRPLSPRIDRERNPACKVSGGTGVCKRVTAWWRERERDRQRGDGWKREENRTEEKTDTHREKEGSSISSSTVQERE